MRVVQKKKKQLLLASIAVIALTVAIITNVGKQPEVALATEVKLKTYEALSDSTYAINAADLTDNAKIKAWALSIIRETASSTNQNLTEADYDKIADKVVETLSVTVEAGNIQFENGQLTDLSKAYISNAVANAISYAKPDVDMTSTVDTGTTQYQQILDMQKTLNALKSSNSELSASVDTLTTVYEEISGVALDTPSSSGETSSNSNGSSSIVKPSAGGVTLAQLKALEDKVEAYYTQLEAEIYANTTTGDTPAGETSDVQVTVTELTETQNTMLTEISTVVSDIQNLTNNLSSVEGSITTVNGKIDSIQQTITTVQDSIKTAQDDLNKSLETAKQDLEKANADNKAALEKADADNKSALEKADADNKSALEKADADNKAALEKADADNKAALEKADADNKSELQGVIDQKVTELKSEIQAESNSSSQALADTKDQLDATDKSLQEQIISSASTALERIAGSITGTSVFAKLGSLYNDVAALRADINRVSGSLDSALSDEIQDRIDDKTAMQNSIDEKIAEVNQAMNQLQQLMDAGDSANSGEIDAAKQALKDKITEINSELAGDITGLSSDTQSKINDISSTLNLLDSSLNGTKEELTNAIDTAKSDLSSQLQQFDTCIQEDIATEAQNREQADQQLQEQIHSSANTDLEQIAKNSVEGSSVFAKIGSLFKANSALDVRLTEEMAAQTESVAEQMAKVNKTIGNLSSSMDNMFTVLQSEIDDHTAAINELQYQFQQFILTSDQHTKVDVLQDIDITAATWGANGTAVLTHPYFVGCTLVEIDYAQKYDITPTYAVDPVAGTLTITIPAAQAQAIKIKDIVCYHTTDDEPTYTASGKPTITFTGEDVEGFDTGTYRMDASATVTITAEPGETIYYSINGGAYQEYTGEFTVTSDNYFVGGTAGTSKGDYVIVNVTAYTQADGKTPSYSACEGCVFVSDDYIARVQGGTSSASEASEALNNATNENQTLPGATTVDNGAGISVDNGNTN